MLCIAAIKLFYHIAKYGTSTVLARYLARPTGDTHVVLPCVRSESRLRLASSTPTGQGRHRLAVNFRSLRGERETAAATQTQGVGDNTQ